MTMDEEIDGIKTVGQMEDEANAPKEETPKDDAKAEEKEPEAEKKPPEEPKPEEPKPDDQGEAPKPEEAKPEAKPEEPAKEDGFGKPGHTPAGVQSRINELTRANREQRDTIEKKDARIAELERQLSMRKEPTRADFKSDEDYISYVADRKARETVDRMEKERESKAQFDREYDGFLKGEDFARKVLPDYDSVMGSAQELPGSARLSSIIRRDGLFGAQILYTLNKFPARRNEYLAAQGEEGKEAVIRKIHDELQAIYDRARAQKPQVQQPTRPQNQAAPVPPKAPQPAQQLREPGELGTQAAKKKINPSECSMEEWMSDGF